MKHIFLPFLIIIFVSSCNSNKNEGIKNQEIKLKTKIDNNDYDIEKSKKFDDFFYMFMLNPEFQKNYISYPIKINNKIIDSKEKWNYIPFFSKKDAITNLSYDTIEQKNSDNYNIKIINFQKRIFKNYQFENQEKWFLVDVKNDKYSEFKDIEFIKFIKKFSKNDFFQKEHIRFPLSFVFANPEKDYETDTIEKTKENWEHIDLSLNLLRISDTINVNSDYRIISFSGIENGIAVDLVFKRINGEWFLIEQFDFST